MKHNCQNCEEISSKFNNQVADLTLDNRRLKDRFDIAHSALVSLALEGNESAINTVKYLYDLGVRND